MKKIGTKDTSVFLEPTVYFVEVVPRQNFQCCPARYYLPFDVVWWALYNFFESSPFPSWLLQPPPPWPPKRPRRSVSAPRFDHVVAH